MRGEGFKALLDEDLRETLEDAERGAAELSEELAERRTRGETPTDIDDLVAVLMRFEVQLTRAKVQREQARRHGLIHDDGYDRGVLAAEAAVIDLCTQLIQLDLAGGDHPGAGDVIARLDRGLASVRADRDLGVQEGWAYRQEKKILARREIAWQKAAKQAHRRLGRG